MPRWIPGGTHRARLGQWISLPHDRIQLLPGLVVAPPTTGVVLGLMDSNQAISALADFVSIMYGRTVSRLRSAA